MPIGLAAHYAADELQTPAQRLRDPISDGRDCCVHHLPDEDDMGDMLAYPNDDNSPYPSDILKWDYPGTDSRWMITAIGVHCFSCPRGSFPSERSPDRDERLLGRWLGRQRRDPKLTAPQAAFLDETLAGWRTPPARGPVNRDHVWRARLQEARAFEGRRHRMPAEGSGNPVEEKLARWIQKQVTFLGAGTLPEARCAELDRELPGWLVRSQLSAWGVKLGEVGAFVAANSRFPSKVSRDRGERVLGAWLHNQRTRLIGVTAAQATKIRALDEAVAGWDD